MLVKFKRNAYLDRLYIVEENPNLVPDAWEDRLPKDAEIVKMGDLATPLKAKPGTALSELAKATPSSMVDVMAKADPRMAQLKTDNPVGPNNPLKPDGDEEGFTDSTGPQAAKSGPATPAHPAKR